MKLRLYILLCIGYTVSYAQESDSLTYEKWIQEVVVSAQHSLYQIQSDKIVYNVSTDSSLIGKTTFDALRYTPLLMVRRNGEVSSVGNWPIEYLVNGRNEPIMSNHIQAATESLDAKYVKRIVVSIKHNIDGSEKLQVNFVTNGRLLGYRGQIDTDLSDKDWWNMAALFLKQRRWGLSIHYSNFWEWGHGSTQESEEWRYNEPQLYHVNRKRKETGFRSDMNNIEVNLTYDISPLKVFSLYGRAIHKTNPYSYSTTDVLAENDVSIPTYQYKETSNYNVNKDAEYQFCTYYEWLFGENAERGKFIAEYQFYRRPKKSETTQHYDNLTYTIPKYVEDFYNMNEWMQEFENWHTLVAMFRRKMKKHEVIVENFLRHRYEGEELRNVKSYDYTTDSHVVSDWSKYIYRQTTNMLRAGYSYNGKRFQAGGGGIYNYLYASSKMLELQNAFSFSQNFFTPYANISIVPTSRSVLRLSYGMGKRIPDIGALNPYIYTNIPGRISYGNPNLQEETTQSLSLSYGFHVGKINLYAASTHTFSKDIILEHQFLKDGILHVTKNNIGKRYESQWTVNASSRFTHTTFGRIETKLYSTNYAATELYKENRGCTFAVSALIEQELPKNFDISVSGGYTSPWIYLQGKSGDTFNYQLRLDKSLPRQRITIGVEANSFIPLYYKTKKEINAEGYYSVTHNRTFHASFLLNFNWRFGKLKVEEHQKENSIEHNYIKYRYDK